MQVQRTPIVNRVFQPPQIAGGWRAGHTVQSHPQARPVPFNAPIPDIDRSFATSTASVDSLGEVESLLGNRPADPVRRRPNAVSHWQVPATGRQPNRGDVYS